MEEETCCQLSAGLGRGHCSWCAGALQGLYAALVPPGAEPPKRPAERRRLWARHRLERALTCLPRCSFTAEDLLPYCVVSSATVERILAEAARDGQLVESMGSIEISPRCRRRLYRAR